MLRGTRDDYPHVTGELLDGAARPSAKGTVVKIKTISVAFSDSPLGRVLVAATTTGLCAVYLGDNDSPLLDALRAGFPFASINLAETQVTSAAIAAITAYLRNEADLPPLPLDPVGTPFQQQVWQALRAIPRGSTRTYGQLAGALGLPVTAARAVGRACAANPLAVVVPCHRALGADGNLRGFRWGLGRKRALLALEGVLLPELDL
ncbi:methylated-DNA--[protein]-cysteine S-methyltransferase [Chloroflexus sp.]|uniref:methylated-DNA--[protein]-cysteine S-methyltransferase n=1 Tax=Chloroflexus sp. TaxID=1904827 RepID=UPI00262FAB38|nr:methylated-DNA--[protein]-cysteine S-methyltransferase [uncultured Chloroflexus sp.]